MSIKICCTEKDGRKIYKNFACSMKFIVEFDYIRKSPDNIGYEITDRFEKWEYAPTIFRCPYCGAKIEEE